MPKQKKLADLIGAQPKESSDIDIVLGLSYIVLKGYFNANEKYATLIFQWLPPDYVLQVDFLKPKK